MMHPLGTLVLLNNNIPIERVTYFNFLGVTFNENLNWNNHADTVATKISRAIGILHNLKYFVPLYVLYILYNSLILPHCTYGILAWGKVNDKVFRPKLQKRQYELLQIVITLHILRSLNINTAMISSLIISSHLILLDELKLTITTP